MKRFFQSFSEIFEKFNSLSDDDVEPPAVDTSDEEPVEGTYIASYLDSVITLKCLSIGTPKPINFPFVSNGKLMDFRCSNIQAL